MHDCICVPLVVSVREDGQTCMNAAIILTFGDKSEVFTALYLPTSQEGNIMHCP